MKKKIILIILLIMVVAGAIAALLNPDMIKNAFSKKIDSSLGGKRGSSTSGNNDGKEEKSNSKEKKAMQMKELSDGKLYYIDDENVKADIVIGDKLYDTQIADINLNFSQYEGKIIEIEGMFLTNNNLTFVGRYSTSNLCPYCPQGYSYFEYQIDEDGAPDFKDEGAWIKVKGKLSQAYDEEYQEDYYYIDVMTIEEMNEWGQETVND